MRFTNCLPHSSSRVASVSQRIKSQLTSSGRRNLESADASFEPDLSKEAIADRTEATREELYRIINEFMDGKKDLYAIADQIASDGREALKAVADENDSYLESSTSSRNLLEVIVRTDGSRPSFMIQNGEVNRASSPLGIWGKYLDAIGDGLRTAIDSVGRINDRNGIHIGTGFRVEKNLIITNRHVLQDIGIKEEDGTWTLENGVYIDFGHEYKSRVSHQPQKLKKLIFCGAQYINGRLIDHKKLDLALIELEDIPGAKRPFLQFQTESDWAQNNAVVFTIGYAGNPGSSGVEDYGFSLLEQLFKSTFGCKRLAPGQIIPTVEELSRLSIAHDATTLGGNSGSLIITLNEAHAAAGLHYGGSIEVPKENWAHVLAQSLDATNGHSSKTLKEHLTENGVQV